MRATDSHCIIRPDINHDNSNLNNNMKATTFELRLSDPTIPAFVRLVAQRALSTLRVKGEGTIEVGEKEFNLLCRYARMQPTKSGQFTFIRIYDELDNSVDIQIETGVFETLGDAFKPAFYPNPLGNI